MSRFKIGDTVTILSDECPTSFPKNSTGKVAASISTCGCRVKSNVSELTRYFHFEEIELVVAVQPTPYWKYILGASLAAFYSFEITTMIIKELTNV